MDFVEQRLGKKLELKRKIQIPLDDKEELSG